MERVTCPKCGESAFASEPFCPACGAVFGQKEATEAKPAPVAFDTPVAHPLTGQLVDALAEEMGVGERVLVSLQNEEATVGFAATNRRVLVLRAGTLGAAYARVSCKELPYLSLDEIKQQLVGSKGKIEFRVRTIAGKPEVGRRGRMGKVISENVAGLPAEHIPEVAAALRKLVAQAEAIQAKREGSGN